MRRLAFRTSARAEIAAFQRLFPQESVEFKLWLDRLALDSSFLEQETADQDRLRRICEILRSAFPGDAALQEALGSLLSFARILGRLREQLGEVPVRWASWIGVTEQGVELDALLALELVDEKSGTEPLLVVNLCRWTLRI